MTTEPRICAHCGSELPASGDYCSQCGAKYEAAQAAPAFTAAPPPTPPPVYSRATPPAPAKSNSTGPMLLVVLVVIACLVLACVTAVVGYFVISGPKPTAVTVSTSQPLLQEASATAVSMLPSATTAAPTPKPTQKPTILPTRTANAGPGPAVTKAPGNPFRDDFSTDKDWFNEKDDRHVMQIENDAYAISVLEADTIWLAFVPVDFQATHLEFDARV